MNQSVQEFTPLGTINLNSTKIRRIRPNDGDVHIKDQRNKKWCMEFCTPESVYHIAVETEIELTGWLEMLERACKLYYQAPVASDCPKTRKTKLFTSKPKKGANVAIGSPSFSRVDTPIPQRAPVEEEVVDTTPRIAIIKEIIHTERDYVNDLEVLVNFYLKPLETYGILKKDFKDAIFGNVENLVPIHQEFLAKLEEEYTKEDPHFSIPFSEIVSNIL